MHSALQRCMFAFRKPLILLGSTSVLLLLHLSTELHAARADLGRSGAVSAPDTQVPSADKAIYVDPQSGKNYPSAGTGPDNAYQTITFALQQAEPGSIIHLAPGDYTSESGEVFPIEIPADVVLRGDVTNRGQRVRIVGSGRYSSSWWGGQNVTLLSKRNAQIAGVSVTNPELRGTGLWIEAGRPTVSSCLFSGNHRDGVFIAGSADPVIKNSLFKANKGNGLSVADTAQGTILSNTFEDTGFGIAVSQEAAPQISDNLIKGNMDGIIVSHTAKPVLRGNTISHNQRDGMIMISESLPDLGSIGSPGNNTFRDNGRYSIYNATQGSALNAEGNDILGRAQIVAIGSDAAPSPSASDVQSEDSIQAVNNSAVNDVAVVGASNVASLEGQAIQGGAVEVSGEGAQAIADSPIELPAEDIGLDNGQPPLQANVVEVLDPPLEDPVAAAAPTRVVDVQTLRTEIESAPAIEYKGQIYVPIDSLESLMQ